MECYICDRPLHDLEVAILENCNHITCSSCMKNWRAKSSESNCPYCRTESRSVIFSKATFKEEEKQTLFKGHENCDLNDPILKDFLDKVDSEEWRTFIQFMLDSQHRLEASYTFGLLCEYGAVNPSYLGNRFAIFQSFEHNFTRVIVFLRLPGVDIQVLLSDEDLYYDDPDFDFADSYVSFLNELWNTSADNYLDHTDKDHVLMMRRFEDIHCILKIDIRRDEDPINNFDSFFNKRFTSDIFLTNFSSLSRLQHSTFTKRLFLYDSDFLAPQQGGDHFSW